MIYDVSMMYLRISLLVFIYKRIFIDFDNFEICCQVYHFEQLFSIHVIAIQPQFKYQFNINNKRKKLMDYKLYLL